MIFSVIMPVYNVEKYLSEAIESVLNQRYKNFELILVNDGSTDKSLEIAQKYKDQDPRIKLISQKNEGLSSARNTGLKNAVGEYIYFIDSDDYIVESTLDEVYALVKTKKYDLVCFLAEPFITNFKTKEENEAIIERYSYHYSRAYLTEGMYSVEEYQNEMFKNNSFVPSACLYVFKKSIVQNNNIQFYKGILYEDNLFTRELLAYSNCMYLISKKLYKRRIRHGSITTSKSDFRKVFSYLIISEELFNLFQLKKKGQYLIKDYKYFFGVAFNLIIKEFHDSNELKTHLFKVHKKLKLREFKYLILELKYPYLKGILLFGKKVKKKLNV